MSDDFELDDKLRAALRDEDSELLARLERDPGLTDFLRAGFHGRMAWWVWLVSFIQVVVFALAVWCGVRFVGAGGIDDRVFWGVWLLLAALAVAMLKMMGWSHVERTMIRREVKRLELQVATLGSRLAGEDPD